MIAWFYRLLRPYRADQRLCRHCNRKRPAYKTVLTVEGEWCCSDSTDCLRFSLSDALVRIDRWREAYYRERGIGGGAPWQT